MPDLHVRLHKDILWLILDRDPLNSLTADMLGMLNTALRKATGQAPHLIVITGTGERAFCAGVDLPDDSEAQRIELLREARATCTLFEELRACGIPTVALVKGSAYGAGCELAALCDTVIAREDATFRLPSVNAKVFPSATAIYLPAAIGQEHSTRLMQSGETLNARAAMRLGLAHQVLPTRRFLADTEELLVMLSTGS
ncbi:MAG TPA: enoyl-CoA hydratase/isomerase family protein [Ktedonobacteraceae bacterium]|nr:enoyl-CoA hydratase/isomerase family protein [Ktedonobacteraceae bacterium]